MCQNSFMERNEQIDRCLENGMPEKIVKSVFYKLKKRAKQAEKILLESQENLKVESNIIKTRTNEFFNATTKINSKTEQQLHPSVSSVKSVEFINTTNSSLRIPKMCGRFNKQMQNSQITNVGYAHKPNEELKEQQYSDVLSVGTAYTKIIFEQLSRSVDQIQQSKIYRLLTQTTQPAHFIAICILSAVFLAIWPDLIESTTATKTKTDTDKFKQKGKNILAAIAYLGAFATHFGSQIWMTFVSGLSLYFSLPRHTFGQCQQILFPKYFAFNSMLSIILLILFVKCFMHIWSLANIVQFATLLLNPVIELIVRLYLAPPMLRLMLEKYKIEYAIGSGQEVGRIVQGDLTQCPHYQRIHKAFRRLHMTVAIGNMIILLSTFWQLYFLASKIQINVS